MRRIFVQWGLLAGLLLLMGCAVRVSTTVVPGTSFKMATFLYRDYSPDESIVAFVDTELARNAADRLYLPLYLSVGNRGNRSVVVSLQKMTLITPSGQVLRPAPFPEVRATSYGRMYQDRVYMAQRPYGFFGNAFSDMHRVDALFYPEMHFDPASTGYETVDLGNLSYFHNLIYFPRVSEPGVYKLTLETNLGTVVNVSFPLYM